MLSQTPSVTYNRFVELQKEAMIPLCFMLQMLKGSLIDKAPLRKRAVVESVNDQLKNISQIEHTRHRSIWNFVTNLLCGLIAYCFQPKKPSLRAKKLNELILL